LLVRDLSSARRSGSEYGRERRNVVLMTLKIAVLAPVPRAKVATTVAVKPGILANVLSA
jgi:hypothetical protein